MTSKQTILASAIIASVIATISSLFVLSFWKGRISQHEQELTVAERVLSTSTIRAGYVILPPDVMIDPNTGKLSGIFVNVLEEAAGKLGLTVDWVEEVTWGTMIEGLNNRRYDIIGSPVWRNSTRAKAADFTDPIFYSGIGAYVRTSDRRFDEDLSLGNSPEIRISAIDGEMAEIIAAEDFPNASIVSLPQLSEPTQMLLEVASQKADLTFVATTIAARYINKNPESVRNLVIAKPVRLFPDCFMVRKGEYALINMLNAAIAELQTSEYVDQMIDQYGDVPEAYYRVDEPYRD